MVLNNVILSTPIVCVVLVIVNICLSYCTDIQWNLSQYLICARAVCVEGQESCTRVCVCVGSEGVCRDVTATSSRTMCFRCMFLVLHRTKLVVTADLVPSGVISFTNTVCWLDVSDFMQKRVSALARLPEYSLFHLLIRCVAWMSQISYKNGSRP